MLSKLQLNITLLCVLYSGFYLFGQSNQMEYTLDQVIEIALQNNKRLQANRLKEGISEAKERDLKMEKLPEVEFHTGFNVLSDIVQYEQGFLHTPTAYKPPRIQYDFTLEASIPIYLGGRLNQEEKRAEIATEITKLNAQKDERLLRLEIITAYLNILHLQDQKELILDKIKEDSVNIKHVEALRANNLVTTNEVLRVQLQLSNHKMSYAELENQISILEHQLKTLISFPEASDFHVSTEGLLTSITLNGLNEEAVKQAYTASEHLNILKKEKEIALWEKRIVKSYRLPQVTAGGEYGFKYPNFMFFPPVAHLYRFGLVGVSVKVPLTSWATSKHKIFIAEQREEIAKLEVEEQEEQIRHNVYKAQRLLKEANEKIVIAKQAIAQAEENYRVVKVKYGNQLSLITELIDADNAFLEAQSRLISLEVNRQLKYYQLEYLLGNL